MCSLWIKEKCFFRKTNDGLESTLKQVYYNPETGFCGAKELKRRTGLDKKQISDFLHEQDEYTRYKPIVRKFKRRRVFVSHIDDQ